MKYCTQVRNNTNRLRGEDIGKTKSIKYPKVSNIHNRTDSSLLAEENDEFGSGISERSTNGNCARKITF